MASSSDDDAPPCYLCYVIPADSVVLPCCDRTACIGCVQAELVDKGRTCCGDDGYMAAKFATSSHHVPANGATITPTHLAHGGGDKDAELNAGKEEKEDVIKMLVKRMGRDRKKIKKAKVHGNALEKKVTELEEKLTAMQQQQQQQQQPQRQPEEPSSCERRRTSSSSGSTGRRRRGGERARTVSGDNNYNRDKYKYKGNSGRKLRRETPSISGRRATASSPSSSRSRRRRRSPSRRYPPSPRRGATGTGMSSCTADAGCSKDVGVLCSQCKKYPIVADEDTVAGLGYLRVLNAHLRGFKSRSGNGNRVKTFAAKEDVTYAAGLSRRDLPDCIRKNVVELLEGTVYVGSNAEVRVTLTPGRRAAQEDTPKIHKGEILGVAQVISSSANLVRSVNTRSDGPSSSSDTAAKRHKYASSSSSKIRRPKSSSSSRLKKETNDPSCNLIFPKLEPDPLFPANPASWHLPSAPEDWKSPAGILAKFGELADEDQEFWADSPSGSGGGQRQQKQKRQRAVRLPNPLEPQSGSPGDNRDHETV